MKNKDIDCRNPTENKIENYIKVDKTVFRVISLFGKEDLSELLFNSAKESLLASEKSNFDSDAAPQLLYNSCGN